MVGVDDELPYAAIVASAHGMKNKGLMAKGNQRLGQNVGERAQAGTQPGAENKRTGNAEACCCLLYTSTCNMADAFHHLSMQVVWQQLFRQNPGISSAGACIAAASALGMRAERNAVSHMEI